MARSPRLLSHGRLVLLLGSLSAFGPLSMDMYLPGLPSMARDLSAPAWAAQLTITASMIGLAGGQLIAGPISDALGRRRPLLAGLAAYMATSLLCAVAANIWLLLGFRVIQGAAGAAGIVIARAIVRDLHTGIAAARFLALLMLVNGLAPILAPLVGGQLLQVTDWRGIFVVLAAIGAVLLVAAWAMLAETLAPQARRGGGLPATVRVFGGLVSDREFMGYALAMGLIAGSPFVLQDIYGASPQLFSLVFALNAGGIIAASQVSRALVDRLGPRTLLNAGASMSALGGLGVLTAVVFDVGLAMLLPSFFGPAGSQPVRHRRPGRSPRRGRRLAHGPADGDRDGHAVAGRPRVPVRAGRPPPAPGGGNDRTRGLTVLSARARRPRCRRCARAGA